MKKPKVSKVKENVPQKISNNTPLIEIKKELKNNLKTYKKEKTLTTKANTTMTESSKEDKKEKKESTTKKHNLKGTSKINKSNLSLTFNEKKRNKTIDADNSTNKKTKIKKHRYSQKMKNTLSQKHFKSNLKKSSSTKFNLIKNKTINNASLLSNNDNNENIILESDDNFIKTLLGNYLDGTDNIINEDTEDFNNIKKNADYENNSLFNEENENTETNTVVESLDIKKKSISKDNIKIRKNSIISNISNNNKKKDVNINTTKISKRDSKLSVKLINNKIKSRLSNSFINNSPDKKKEERMSLNSLTENRIKISNNSKKNCSNIQIKIKSYTNKTKTLNANTDEKEKMKRKILYSTKIINNINKLKQNNKTFTQSYANKKNLIPIIASNLNLDVIFENKIKANPIVHHYLENTISAKNKIVQKKKINPLEEHKNTLNLFHKEKKDNNYTEINDFNSNENMNVNFPLFNKNILRLNKTPKIKKILKERFSLNASYQTRNYNSRKFSQQVNFDLNLENNISSKTIINSKIFSNKIDDYLITRELGKGSYAVVKLAVHKNTKNKYAIKIYSKQCLIEPQLRNTVKNEINILKQLDDKNVMKLYEVIDTPSNLYLVLEYINGINLLEIIKNEKYHYIPESRAKKIFVQVVKGIAHCHKKNIFHRDIKLENILVLKDDTVKIIDFGFGIICKPDTYQKLFCGTKSYMPPEIIKKEKYIACYSDIWSLGVLFFAMLFGIFPFKGKDEDELFEKIKEAKLCFPEYNPISDKTKKLFEKIFVINPCDRICLEDIIKCLEEE